MWKNLFVKNAARESSEFNEAVSKLKELERKLTIKASFGLVDVNFEVTENFEHLDKSLCEGCVQYRVFHSNPESVGVHNVWEPHSSIHPHHHDVDEVINMVGGKLRVTILDENNLPKETTIIGMNHKQSITIKANETHFVESLHEKAEFIVVFVRKP